MSKNQGCIRVVNVRGDEDFCPIRSHKPMMVDRTNPVLGNRHGMKAQSRLAHDRVIAAHKVDLEADIARKGPMVRCLLVKKFARQTSRHRPKNKASPDIYFETRLLHLDV